MREILFVCRGNVCRSQMAEGFNNHNTKANNATSAGISKRTLFVYRHPVRKIQKVMREEGIDISKARVKTLTPEWLSPPVVFTCFVQKQNVQVF